jgi:threonine/homoserine/homoserine lactone efflux protein
MAYDPTLLLIAFGMFAIGLLGLVLCMLGLSWFITHPRMNGESFRRGRRRNMLASTILGILFIGIGVLPFAPSPF